jgi:hypothetical protein
MVCFMAGTIMTAQETEARSYTSEVLNYQVVYHWGLIWKHAGNATLSIKNTGSGYQARFYGTTISWARTIYPVNDTLLCSMLYNFSPTKYQKLTHEGHFYGKDVVDFSYANNTTYGKCTVVRKDKPVKYVNLSSPGKAYDMVSVFYMLRSLDFDELSRNKVYTTVVFSGKRKENLSIRYKGVENVKLRDNSTHQAYHIVFTFTQDGRTKSSDDISAWMTTDAARIPLLLVGKLPVGEIKCYYAK